MGADPLVPTPPCAEAGGYVGFDASDSLYYQCGATLRRNDGELLGASIRWLEAVLPSGRTVISHSDLLVPTFTLLDVDGREISSPDFSDWVGVLEPVQNSSSVQGESAWMLFDRTFAGPTREVVVMRVDGDTGEWRVVRRVSTPDGIGAARIALPDGRVFGMRRGALTIFDYEFLEYPPDGPMRVAWREFDAAEVRLHSGQQFMVGPLL